MKKMKFAIIAVALGISFAFAGHAASHNAKIGDPSYYWFTTGGTYDDEATISAEQTSTGCNGSVTLCQNGYNSSQLVNPSEPNEGVKMGESPAAKIYNRQ